MLGVFSAPGAAFRKLKEKPVWVAAFIIYLVVSLAVSYIAISKIDTSDVRARIEETMRSRGATEEQIQQQTEQWEKMAGNAGMRFGFQLGSVLVMTVVMFLLLSLILMPLVPLCGGTGPNFGRNLAIVSYASLVSIPGFILKGILMLLRGPTHADIGLSLFLPKAQSGFLYSFLARIDPFTVWNTILVALGLKMMYDLKDNRSYYYIFALWLAFLAISSLLGGAAAGVGPR
jgi:hypothetical protein